MKRIHVFVVSELDAAQNLGKRFCLLRVKLWRSRFSLPTCLPTCPLAHYRYCSDKPLSHLKRAADDLPWKCKIFAFILQQGRCVQVYLVILLLRCLQHLQMWLDRLSLSQGSVLANTRSPPCQSTQPKLLIC